MPFEFILEDFETDQEFREAIIAFSKKRYLSGKTKSSSENHDFLNTLKEIEDMPEGSDLEKNQKIAMYKRLIEVDVLKHFNDFGSEKQAKDPSHPVGQLFKQRSMDVQKANALAKPLMEVVRSIGLNLKKFVEEEHALQNANKPIGAFPQLTLYRKEYFNYKQAFIIRAAFENFQNNLTKKNLKSKEITKYKSDLLQTLVTVYQAIDKNQRKMPDPTGNLQKGAEKLKEQIRDTVKVLAGEKILNTFGMVEKTKKRKDPDRLPTSTK